MLADEARNSLGKRKRNDKKEVEKEVKRRLQAEWDEMDGDKRNEYAAVGVVAAVESSERLCYKTGVCISGVDEGLYEGAFGIIETYFPEGGKWKVSLSLTETVALAPENLSVRGATRLQGEARTLEFLEGL